MQRIRHLVIAMPAYNESDGLPGFLDEVRACVTPLTDQLTFVIADDNSTDGTAATLESLGAPDIAVRPQPLNRGHGPTALAAYRAALELAPDVLVHVDGDGQFLGTDFPRLIEELTDAVDVVHGVRIHRTDPWFRKAITALVRATVMVTTGKAITDVNTPLRAYRPEVARALVEAVGPDAEVPHVHFSLAEMRWGFRRADVRVKSIPRRGASETGTMWGKTQTPKLPPKRLRQFVRRAGRELWRMSLRPGAPLKQQPRG